MARVGLWFSQGHVSDDLFWAQVYRAIESRSHDLPIETVHLPHSDDSHHLQQPELLLASIRAHELDVLIDWPFNEQVSVQLLNEGLPIVYLSETKINHPLAVSPLGLEQVAEQLSAYMAQELAGTGRVLVVGGLMQLGLPDDGESRLRGIKTVLQQYPQIKFYHIPSHWTENPAREQYEYALSGFSGSLDAILGLSDKLALQAKSVAFDLGLCKATVKLYGINGEANALAAIMQSKMQASIGLSPSDLGRDAINLAARIVHKQSYPAHFRYKSHLINTKNVATIAAQRLLELSEHLKRPYEEAVIQQKNKTLALETLAFIDTNLTSAEDLASALANIASLIAENYRFDQVFITLKGEAGLEHYPYRQDIRSETSLWQEVLALQTPLLIPDQLTSKLSLPDQTLTRTRLMLPMGCKGQTTGFLDLHAHHLRDVTNQDMEALEAIANHLAVLLSLFRPENPGQMPAPQIGDANPIILFLHDASLLSRFYWRELDKKFPKQIQSVRLSARLDSSFPESLKLVLLVLSHADANLANLCLNLRAQQQSQRLPLFILTERPLNHLLIERFQTIKNLVLHNHECLTSEDFIGLLKHFKEESTALKKPNSQLLKQVLAYLHEHYAERLTRADLSQRFAKSENYLSQIFKAELGIALWTYLNRLRISKAKELLVQTNLSVTRIAEQVGFDDPAYFSRMFKQLTGYSARAYRRTPQKVL